MIIWHVLRLHSTDIIIAHGNTEYQTEKLLRLVRSVHSCAILAKSVFFLKTKVLWPAAAPGGIFRPKNGPGPEHLLKVLSFSVFELATDCFAVCFHVEKDVRKNLRTNN